MSATARSLSRVVLSCPCRLTARNAAPSIMPDAASQARHAHRAGRGSAAVGQASDFAAALLISFGSAQHADEAFVVLADVVDVEPRQLGASQRAGEAHHWARYGRTAGYRRNAPMVTLGADVSRFVNSEPVV
jgi:hypothetical protein